MNTWLDRTRPNALNLFRLIFAGMVVVAHAYTCMGRADPLLWLQSWTLGSVAVDGFFITSGFLIVGSWCSPSNSADKYLKNRVLRIFPGFVVAVFVSALIAAAACWPHSLGYLKTIHPQIALLQIVTLHQEFLNTPLAFPLQPDAHLVNASLWTIPIEFDCYLAVALVGSLGLLKPRWPVIAFFFVSMLYFILAELRLGLHTTLIWPVWLGGTIWRFPACFGAGGLFFIFRDSIPRSRAVAAVCVAVLIVAIYLRALQLAIPIFGAYLLFYWAFGMPMAFNRIGSRNDISYGVYLYAFPLQQLYGQLAMAGLLPSSPVMNALIAGSFAVGAGWLSCKYVEQPFLKHRSKQPVPKTDPVAAASI